jgi:hypothetical protein
MIMMKKKRTFRLTITKRKRRKQMKGKVYLLRRQAGVQNGPISAVDHPILILKQLRQRMAG